MDLFEKYGIKEVADVTFYRIERKKEINESQRVITIGSVLKGALELKTVYPDASGVGAEEGFEAYVFTDAIIPNETTYACGDTHAYTYTEQIGILFAKNQNLITNTGSRYQFTSLNFGNIVFSESFYAAPNSTEKLVVAGFSGKLTEALYNVDEINDYIKTSLTTTIKAKAYNVVYRDYAELIVEDEMGYFNPNQLASNSTITTAYSGTDTVLTNATQWKADTDCESINDAIDALRKKKMGIDFPEASTLGTLTSISGGYEVDDALTLNHDDIPNIADQYKISATGAADVTCNYTLAAVLEALNTLAADGGSGAVTVTKSSAASGVDSNRAIYVNLGGQVSVDASAYVYLLRNVNYKSLDTDTSGNFKFTSRTGETVYYHDKVFMGTEYLALVVVGTNGIVFKVGRCGTKSIEKVAWMVNTNGYVTDAQAKTLVNNGIIHLVEVDVDNETFDAVCTLDKMSVRKFKKTVLRYVPVLFLDTLKISTIETTGQETFANGGQGNANLIGWDYGKEITVQIQDALYTPASMALIFGAGENGDFTKGVKGLKRLDRMEPCTAPRSFIVPAGNSKGVPSEGDVTAQAVYIDPTTMKPYQDGTPIAEGEKFLKWTRSVAYGNNTLGTQIEISADKFPGTYKVVGDTQARRKSDEKDQRFMFVIPEAKMTTEQTITLEAEGDPSVFDMNLTVLRPDDGVMIKLIQYDVVENEEENDGSTMVAGTENLNLLDDAEMFRVSGEGEEEEEIIGATEY